ncbi:hypothetical protein L873DRAFT_1826184 [Choiromyces venosus 120613-1]|uniref:Uncharacterized protein n=1 Tax=Choiromyces venosus 120613-1 TaxID=1336337 RepID=A0A3N4K2C8_9PEZI|nr:hypothetical protein L873DRAFT_1826184 [Choiromyces venosus 120613-1]
MVDFRAPAYQFPHRKPTGPDAPPPLPTKNILRINPNYSSQNSYGPPSATSSSSHTRRRTSSSGTLPMQGIQGTQTYTQNYNNNFNYNYPQTPHMNRRPSVASNSRGGAMDPTVPITIRRSGSTHTTNSASTTAQNAYVATLRRQKATVWCDRSQHEDPRLLAAQRAAKLRAAMEVVGSSNSAFLSAGHNHHGIGSATGSAASSISGGRTGKLGKTWVSAASPGIGGGSLPSGVPTRLSATEVLGDDDEDDLYSGGAGIHKRSGSGKSSLNSNHRRTNRSSSMISDTNRNSTTYSGTTGGLQHRNSRGSTPSYSSTSSIAEEGTPGTTTKPKSKSEKVSESPSESAPPRPYHTPTLQNSGILRRDNTLKRRGSLDEQEVVRTMTLSGNRLFVANPDVE